MSENAWWSQPVDELFVQLRTSEEGLSTVEAVTRRPSDHAVFTRSKLDSDWVLLLSQLRNPTMMILVAASVLSLFLNDKTDAGIILIIVLTSVLLGFFQERSAARTMSKLLDLVRTQSSVVRDGSAETVRSEDVVAGDIITLSAGSSVPGDCRLLETKDLYLDEAALTGETFPVEKQAGLVTAETPLAQRLNVIFLGTHVVSGTGRAVVVASGSKTEFGRISEHLRLRAPETDFERGIRRFGYFLMEITLTLVVSIFAINVYLHKPVLESFLFALALAVGLTPQLLPAIIMINLTYGAQRLAKSHVIVRRLASIENFGSMTVLCSDKTGTLTEGIIHVQGAIDPHGAPSEMVSRLAYLNALYETGFGNPIDDAIRATPPSALTASTKLDEVPYDFLRKRLSILVEQDNRHILITKGALSQVLEICTEIECADGSRSTIELAQQQIQARFEELSRSGCRTLGVAYRDMGPNRTVTRDDEVAMRFVGFLVLKDPPKAESRSMIAELRKLHVSLKMVTGDNRWVATEIAKQVGLSIETIVLGSELREMSDMALARQVGMVDVFAEVEPNQKERIILALQKSGQVVGYLGDGINDATALHAADVGISVDTAVDVAKEAADIVLLQRELSVLVEGIRAGRQTFANTVKYVFMATSANFGNMFSMAGASLFLPFLPLLPQQILLANLLTDISGMTIAGDSVDSEEVSEPRRWDIRFIRNFMLTFGLLSSIFDYVTFGVLLWVLHADKIGFRTGWFVESVCSATLVVLVIRTRRSCLSSRPSRPLLYSTLLVLAATLALPMSPLAAPLGFASQSLLFPLVLVVILISYVAMAEVTKRLFYRLCGRSLPQFAERQFP
jgi:Mg2+-importing ATPase